MNEREIATLERINRCSGANTAHGVRMRHCESCEVPVGTMLLEDFYRLRECTACKKPVHVVNLGGGDE